MAHVVIVGAGISGLSTAFYLQEALPEAEVTVLEAGPRPGGTLWTERRDGFLVEVGANAFPDNKHGTLDLCGRLGLKDRLIPASEAARHRYLFLNGKLQRLPGSLASFLFSPLLSLRGKASLLFERYRPRRQETSDESVHDFVCRRAGREAAIFADALVTGIYAGDPRLLSMDAAFPRVVEMEQRYGSVMRGMSQAAKERRAQAAARGESPSHGSRLWTFREGLGLLMETLAQRLKKPLLTGIQVRAIEKTSDRDRSGWYVHGAANERWQADMIVLACPAHAQARMLEGLDHALAELVAQIAYSPAVVIALGYRRDDVPGDLNGFGYIAPQQARRDLLGVQWCSSLFPGRAPGGLVLLRAIAGGWNRPEIITWDDERLLQAARAELREAMHVAAAPVFHHVVRWERAIPQYHLGHRDRVAAIERLAAKRPGLFLTGNAYSGVALNDCTEQGEWVAKRVAEYAQLC